MKSDKAGGVDVSFSSVCHVVLWFCGSGFVPAACSCGWKHQEGKCWDEAGNVTWKLDSRVQPSRQLLALLQTTDKSKFNVAQDTFTVQNLSDHLQVTYLTTDSHIVTRRRCWWVEDVTQVTAPAGQLRLCSGELRTFQPCFTCQTTCYWWEVFSHVGDDQNRYFKPNDDVFLILTMYEIISTARWQERNRKLNMKMQHEETYSLNFAVVSQIQS